jgi:peptidoglycan L-alanyl-D-glutamate endopeptidase CwlK
MGKLNARSMRSLDGVHEDLVRVVLKARERCDFLVTCGLRTKEEQRELVKIGRSKTTNSRHLYGLAVDLCDIDGKYDIPDMEEIAKAMKMAALELGIPIEWGGDWRKKPTDRIGWDSPHFQLPKAQYPDKADKRPRFVMKPGDASKAAGAVIATGAAVKEAADAGALPVPSFDQVAGVVSAAPDLRIGVAAAVVGALVYFVVPWILRRLGWAV